MSNTTRSSRTDLPAIRADEEVSSRATSSLHDGGDRTPTASAASGTLPRENVPEKRGLRRWLFALVAIHALLYLLTWFVWPKSDPLSIAGFRGNMVAGLLGSFFFFVLGTYLNRGFEQLQIETNHFVRELQAVQKSTSETVKQLSELQGRNVAQTAELEKVQVSTRDQTIEIGKTQSVIASMQRATLDLATEVNSLLQRERERRDEQDRVDAFLDFLRRLRHYDIRIPSLVTKRQPHGLEYAVEPVRGPDGQPRHLLTETSDAYVVRIPGPAHRDMLDPEELAEYLAAPIRVGESYFCSFRSGQWHLSDDEFTPGYLFWLSGSVTDAVILRSANDFVGDNSPPAGFTSLGVVVVTSDGVRVHSGRGTRAEVFASPENALFVKIGTSPLKHLDMSLDPPNVENIEGYFDSEAAVTRFRTLLIQIVKNSPARGG